MTTLAERQAEFCSYFVPVYPMRSSAVIGGNGTQENMCEPVTAGVKDHGSDGVLQWRLERLNGPDGLMPWCTAQGIPWDTLKSQALFTMHELDHPQYAALKADLKAGAKSLETLTLNFCDAFERPSAAGRAADARIRYAHDCLAILVRNSGAFPGPVASVPSPVSLPAGLPAPTKDLQMPIEAILQLIAPLAESLVAGLIKGVLAQVQTSGLPASSTHPAVPASAPALPPIDFAALAAMIAKELAVLNAPKPAP
jgi:Phage tail lysozyme